MKLRALLALAIALAFPAAANAQAVGTPTGLTPYFYRNLGSTVQNIKSSAGTLYAVVVNNYQSSTAAYIQLFNTTATNVTLGTTEVTQEVECPSSATPCVFYIPSGIGAFSSIGWSIASTTTEHGSTGSASGVQITAYYL
jgi:hypothetical protein